MAILLKSEKRTFKARLLYGSFYALLIAGSLTMVYPFLLMLSGSLKSGVDAYEFDIIPRYFSETDLLYRKYLESKCDEMLEHFRVHYRTDTLTYKDPAPPPPCAPAVLSDWEQFCRQQVPPSFYVLGHAATLRVGRTTPRNLRNFRRHLMAECNGDIEVCQKRYVPNALSWFSIYAPWEHTLCEKKAQVANTALMEEFYRFKVTRPAEERVYLSCDGYFAKIVKIDPKYNQDIAQYNKACGTAFTSFDQIHLPRTVPEHSVVREHWEAFVRSSFNPQFILLSDAALPGYRDFLKEKYSEVANLNKNYGSTWETFDAVPFPKDRVHTSPMLTDYALFLEDRKRLPLDQITLDTPEFRYRDLLKAKYGTVEALNAAHQQKYASFDEVGMPQANADWAYVQSHSGELRGEFALRNYQTVIEYIGLYGRGVWNTIVYCTLAVVMSLLVNPLAAYALSRYRMPSQYKILFFLMATMTFPPIVTAIPNFLMLKELNLLNTFWALILPVMANGYSIFLLKGFFDSLPREMYEAAEIDGATEWHKFWIITINLSKPILGVIALNAFNAAYSNFMFALIVCQDREMWTLMVWLFEFQQFAGQEVVFASLLVAAVPTLVVFVLCQNLILKGLVVPTEK